MSTTVTYKGAALTTVTNGTKVLLTSGKYMEDDVTLVDDSRGAVPSSLGKVDCNVSLFGLTWETLAEENI